MKDTGKTKAQLILELGYLRQKVAHLEIGKTERKQAEAESKLRLELLDSATDSIFVHDFEGNFIYVNETACKVHGYSRRELMKLKLQDVVVPEEFRGLGSGFHEVMEKGRGILESAHRRKNGSIMPVEIHGRTIDLGGRKLFLTVIRDITERKRMEEELLLEKNKLEALVDAMESGLTIQDKDYNIIYQNKILENIFGNRLGEKCYKAYENRDKICGACPAEMVFKDGKSRTSERMVVIPSGEITYWENTASPVRDAKGEIVGCLEIARNITERKQAAAKLSEAELRYHTLFEQSPDGVMIIDSETAEVLEFNDAACKQLGYSRDEFAGIGVSDFEALEQPEETLRHIRQIQEQGIAEFITKHRTKQGEIKDVMVVSKPIDIAGKIFHLSIHRDITESKRMEDELKLKAQLLDNATDFIFLRDLAGNFVYANETALKALGYTREEFLNLKVDQIIAPGNPWVNGLLLEALMAKGTVTFETADLCKDGSTIPVESHARFVETGSKKLVLSTVRDVTERKKLEETIRQLAHYDSLTGLPNRNLFNDRITLALAHAARYDEGLALMMMDLDKFKEINDTLGHGAGDELLKDVGGRLVSIVRKTDTVSRMGGDEFVLVLTGVTNEEDVTNIAQKLADAVRKPFSYDGHEFTVTTSIGIAFYPTDGKDSNTLLKHADRALYYVKNKGRDGYLRYTPKMNGKSLK